MSFIWVVCHQKTLSCYPLMQILTLLGRAALWHQFTCTFTLRHTHANVSLHRIGSSYLPFSPLPHKEAVIFFCIRYPHRHFPLGSEVLYSAPTFLNQKRGFWQRHTSQLKHSFVFKCFYTTKIVKKAHINTKCNSKLFLTMQHLRLNV